MTEVSSMWVRAWPKYAVDHNHFDRMLVTRLKYMLANITKVKIPKHISVLNFTLPTWLSSRKMGKLPDNWRLINSRLYELEMGPFDLRKGIQIQELSSLPFTITADEDSIVEDFTGEQFTFCGASKDKLLAYTPELKFYLFNLEKRTVCQVLQWRPKASPWLHHAAANFRCVSNDNGNFMVITGPSECTGHTREMERLFMLVCTTKLLNCETMEYTNLTFPTTGWPAAIAVDPRPGNEHIITYVEAKSNAPVIDFESIINHGPLKQYDVLKQEVTLTYEEPGFNAMSVLLKYSPDGDLILTLDYNRDFQDYPSKRDHVLIFRSDVLLPLCKIEFRKPVLPGPRLLAPFLDQAIIQEHETLKTYQEIALNLFPMVSNDGRTVALLYLKTNDRDHMDNAVVRNYVLPPVMRTLKALCRTVILRKFTRRNLQKLPLPRELINYLQCTTRPINPGPVFQRRFDWQEYQTRVESEKQQSDISPADTTPLIT
ncbi:uncharacterized protein LOC106172069 [Lingula anatina]|uniref:Uncharacterized protein LOC106172069 n=1 Tax=Lingula anatina TaxID=7574 RepID=A0A1S3JD66_LINAN|nr:uncharacterized protein LOC106172069 [Lingula anatina]|eukprot:XP_013408116.1 uncharacterized protein LOC106172069 [Lingula anatina]